MKERNGSTADRLSVDLMHEREKVDCVCRPHVFLQGRQLLPVRRYQAGRRGRLPAPHR